MNTHSVHGVCGLGGADVQTDFPRLLVSLLYLGPKWPLLVSPSALSPPPGTRGGGGAGPAAYVDATRFPFIGLLSDAGACVEWAANLVQGEGGGPRTMRRPFRRRSALAGRCSGQRRAVRRRSRASVSALSPLQSSLTNTRTLSPSRVRAERPGCRLRGLWPPRRRFSER